MFVLIRGDLWFSEINRNRCQCSDAAPSDDREVNGSQVKVFVKPPRPRRIPHLATGANVARSVCASVSVCAYV